MINSIRGFRDIFHPDSTRLTALENTAREVLNLYGFSELRLPAVEYRDLFVKSTGETSDIVEKEMYVFEDAGHRLLALRPEGTPGVARAYIEHNLYSKEPRQKLFYIGGMYRAERPQAGRYREFEQIGAEYIGNAHYAADAEAILALARLLRRAGVNDFRIDINSLGCQKCRPAHRDALFAYLQAHKDELCENCKQRMERNPLRALDCKLDGPKLAANAPKQVFCPECEEHYKGVKELLAAGGETFTENPNLVRGLDYYTRTVFEFRATGIGSQDAIAAGGRYDTLLKSMGGADLPAVGWALGADRVIAVSQAQAKDDRPLAFVISMCPEAHTTAFRLMEELRQKGIAADGGVFGQSFKSQMRGANKSGAKFALILGGDEIKKNTVALKDLTAGTQTEVAITEAASAISGRQGI